jgi:hypothetical protein
MRTLSTRVPLSIRPHKAGRRNRWLAVLLWSVFGAGLLVQGFAPQLRMINHAFVIPSSLISNGKDIRPAEIVERERRMQLLSAILTAGGALGLALRYRRALVRPSVSRTSPD